MCMRPASAILAAATSLALLGAGACAHRTASAWSRVQSPVQSLIKPAPAEFEDRAVDGSPGVRVVLPHYVIDSTIQDRQLLAQLGDLMEGALYAYRSLAPDVPVSTEPMRCYVFRTRAQWADFTQEHTGDDAAIYLRVNRGGYTVGDWFVAYWIGDIATFSVAAHEGWHQYVARHFKGRLPPFLEEGLACLFEQVKWEGELPRWDLAQNQARLMALRSAMDMGEMYPLGDLVRMHAGQVVGKSSGKIEAFYAESWAFARFLYDGDHGSHRAALRRMIADAARGTLYGDSSREMSRGGGPLWDPATARPMLEHYLGQNLSAAEEQFRSYVQRLADQMPAVPSES